MNTMTDEEIRKTESRWKSDMDKKMDRMCEFADKYEDYLALCLEREQSRKKLRDALIEKTLGALILSGVAVAGIAAWNYLKLQLNLK